ncbi:MAG: hypothetical protein LBQ60_06945 [Bacteroidales bacterium]|jgi:hypothetical protein|nr:hypothetical protein [Bacteroidales bacterium]
MNAPQIKKPTLAWVIIGFIITFVLLVTSLDVIEKLWYMFAMFILWDITALVSYFSRMKAYRKMLKDAAEVIPVKNDPLAIPATIKVVRDSSFVGAIVPYKVYLNNCFAGKLKNGKSLELSTSDSHNIVMVFDNNDNPFQGDFVADLEDGGYAEVHVKAGRFVKRQTPEVPRMDKRMGNVENVRPEVHFKEAVGKHKKKRKVNRTTVITIAAIIVMLVCFERSPKNEEIPAAAGTVDAKPTIAQNPKAEKSKIIPDKNTKALPGTSTYKGKANFSEIQNFEVSFSLSPDKKEIRNLVIAISGLKVTARYENMQIQQTGTSMTTTYAGTFAVKDNKADISLGRNGNLSVELNNTGATGTIAYTYIISGSTGQNSHPDIPVNLGRASIRFQVQ